MLYGIVDVGSNTIRLGVYDCEGPAFRVLLAKKETAGLAGYVRKGNLSAQGIDRCIQVLRAYQAAVEPFRLPPPPCGTCGTPTKPSAGFGRKPVFGWTSFPAGMRRCWTLPGLSTAPAWNPD